MADDVGADLALESFRAEARTWLEENFPSSLKGGGAMNELSDGEGGPSGDALAWRERIGAKGWTVPTWPKQYGGGGLSASQARVLAQEMARIRAYNPANAGMGITMIGPTILDYGTEEQKQRHIPPIARGEVRWCVGYSEPGAGSDLASLTTKCEDAGDHWRINGQKIWTSGAQYSDWCGGLVRTDTSKKHEGISFLLIPMHQAGVETRPIKLIAGASPFCETFFTDATAAKDDMLGPLNGGWTVGKRLLQHERASQTGGGNPMAAGRQETLQALAKRYVEVDDKGRIADSGLRTRIASHLMDAQAHNLTIARVRAEAKSDGATTTASILKNSATAVAQTRAELTLEIMGHQGLGWEGETFTGDEINAVRGWLGGKAMSIYGGSFEVQNNIISKRILGLPDLTSST